MAKINVFENAMARLFVREAISGETEEWKDLKPDENGLCDLSIQLNGKEINVDRFLMNLKRSYDEAVKQQAADLLSAEYAKILHSIYDKQEALEHQEKLFDEMSMD